MSDQPTPEPEPQDPPEPEPQPKHYVLEVQDSVLGSSSEFKET